MFSEAAQAMVQNLTDIKTVKITTYINSCIVDILHRKLNNFEQANDFYWLISTNIYFPLVS